MVPKPFSEEGLLDIPNVHVMFSKSQCFTRSTEGPKRAGPACNTGSHRLCDHPGTSTSAPGWWMERGCNRCPHWDGAKWDATDLKSTVSLNISEHSIGFQRQSLQSRITGYLPCESSIQQVPEISRLQVFARPTLKFH